MTVLSSRVHLFLFAAFLCLPLAAAPCARAATHHADVVALLNNGHANDAIAALNKILAAHPQDATAHNLLCRVQYQEQRWSSAAHECEAAVHLQPGNSEFHDWLGRVYGAQAQDASKFSAFGLARKVHSEFQTATQLDPHNVDALCDLAEFSLDAPGFLGGGMDHAEAIAKQLQPINAEKYHGLLAQIARKKKDSATAERELKAAIAQSKSPASAWMNLASFYAREKNFPAMSQAIQSGIAADKHHDSALVDGASTLIHHKQDFSLAEQMLRQYLAPANEAHQTEDAPAFQVHEQLGHLLEKQGNKAAAQQQYAAAAALASNYAGLKH